jgi:hypothetical protein
VSGREFPAGGVPRRFVLDGIPGERTCGSGVPWTSLLPTYEGTQGIRPRQARCHESRTVAYRRFLRNGALHPASRMRYRWES